MKKYSARVLVRTPDRVRSTSFTTRALSIADALVQFERTARRDLVFIDYEIEAIWQCLSCECRAKGKNR